MLRLGKDFRISSRWYKGQRSMQTVWCTLPCTSSQLPKFMSSCGLSSVLVVLTHSAYFYNPRFRCSFLDYRALDMAMMKAHLFRCEPLRRPTTRQ